jgi:endonuclease YncB( thermonuclease family)
MRLSFILLTIFSFSSIYNIVIAEDSSVPATIVMSENKDKSKVESHATSIIVQPSPTESEKKDDVKKIKLRQGKVSTIHNSVSFTVKDDTGKEHILRLAEINTPYLDKPHGPESLKALKDLIDNKDVSYEILTTDRMGKKIVKANVGTIKINAFMIENGHAWMSKKFGHDPELIELQDKAKAARVGLWANARAGLGSKGMKRRTHKHQS